MDADKHVEYCARHCRGTLNGRLPPVVYTALMLMVLGTVRASDDDGDGDPPPQAPASEQEVVFGLKRGEEQFTVGSLTVHTFDMWCFTALMLLVLLVLLCCQRRHALSARFGTGQRCIGCGQPVEACRCSGGATAVATGAKGEQRFLATFQAGILGFSTLYLVDGTICVDAVSGGSQAETFGVRAGDAIVSFGGTATRGLSKSEFLELVRATPRPAQIGFSRAVLQAGRGSSSGRSGFSSFRVHSNPMFKAASSFFLGRHPLGRRASSRNKAHGSAGTGTPAADTAPRRESGGGGG
eukprot:g8140.t1